MGGCGQSKTNTKRLRRDKQKERLEEADLASPENEVDPLEQITNENKRSNAADDIEKRKVIEQRLFKMPLGSPDRHENMIKGILPDYMLDKKALDHADKLSHMKHKQETLELYQQAEKKPQPEPELHSTQE